MNMGVIGGRVTADFGNGKQEPYAGASVRLMNIRKSGKRWPHRNLGNYGQFRKSDKYGLFSIPFLWSGEQFGDGIMNIRFVVVGFTPHDTPHRESGKGYGKLSFSNDPKKLSKMAADEVSLSTLANKITEKVAKKMFKEGVSRVLSVSKALDIPDYKQMVSLENVKAFGHCSIEMFSQ